MSDFPEFITLILKLTESCNYQCCFCRYANHTEEHSVMDVVTVQEYIEKALKYNIEQKHLGLKIVFHGGEPLLWGIERFQQIMDFERKCERKFRIKFRNCIQTNGYLLNDEWVLFLKNNKFQVGISLDGPLELNKHYGRLGNEVSMDIVLNNIKKLKSKNVSFGILSVITPEHLGKEELFYNFWIDNKIENIGLCYCYNPNDGISIDAYLLSDFLIKLFDFYFWGEKRLNIREFNNAIAKVLNKKSNSCTNACREKCGYFFSVTSNGDVCFCDEYDREKKNIIGNLNVDSIMQIVEGDRFQVIKRECKDIILTKCDSCSVYSICGAGCRRHDINNKQNYFCKTYTRLYEHIRKNVNMAIMEH